MFVMTVDGFRQSGKLNNELATGDFLGMPFGFISYRQIPLYTLVVSHKAKFM